MFPTYEECYDFCVCMSLLFLFLFLVWKLRSQIYFGNGLMFQKIISKILFWVHCSRDYFPGESAIMDGRVLKYVFYFIRKICE